MISNEVQVGVIKEAVENRIEQKYDCRAIAVAHRIPHIHFILEQIQRKEQLLFNFKGLLKKHKILFCFERIFVSCVVFERD
jgi:hypothetical protein